MSLLVCIAFNKTMTLLCNSGSLTQFSLIVGNMETIEKSYQIGFSLILMLKEFLKQHWLPEVLNSIHLFLGANETSVVAAKSL